MLPLRRVALVALLTVFAATASGCGVDPGDQAAAPSSSSDRSNSTTTRPDATTTTTAPDTTTTKPDPTTSTTSPDLSPTEKAMVERAKDLYVQLGMDPDDADCLARGLVAAGAGEGTIDPTDTGAMMDIVNECDIDMSEIAALGSENGLDSMEDGLKFGLESSLEAGGLTEDEAECVSSAFVDQYGTDVSAMQDQAKVQALLKGCGVDPSKYGG
jgi:hypothetical protein